ncbi:MULTISPECIES: hypothetical protein [Microbacterium]|uniref:Uncharacterized protein n=2 Tax=Microbacterium maritypicum TaxID=33918 RepID=A0ACD4BAK3_MICMQ|nr:MULTISPECIES: hypothetical protein [Microbacterium]EYT58969.1 hypothetical protein D514_0108995 [Microbacterium sp. UCD-TDU]UTT54455.1 hypothetical protein NMQ05_07725 [Microbacterium liquefaciens]WEF22416.1 hypothetical protein PWF71_07005 [Microbacterium liquefaciens]
MSNPIIPPVPPVPHDDDAPNVPTREVDGERVLDPDVDDALVDSAEADRLAAGADDDGDDTDV